MGANSNPGIGSVNPYNNFFLFFLKPKNVEHPFWGRQPGKVTVFDKSERWDGKYVQRGWEMQSKVTVELPTDRPVLGQSVDRLPCLWMIDSKGDRLAQRGGRVKLPQTTPGQTSSYSNTHTFLGNRLKIHSLLRLRGPLLCVVVHICLPASITPSALLLSHCLTLRVIHTQPNVAVWYKHKGSLFRNYNPTQIQHCGKKA